MPPLLIHPLYNAVKRSLCVGFLLAGLLATSTLPAQGQTANAYGTPLLRMDPHARSVGMGGASAALILPYGLLRYNPAGIGFLEYPVLSASYHSWIQDTHQNHFNAAFPLWRGGYGVSISYLDAGSLDEVDADFQPTGTTLSSNDVMLVAGGAQRFRVLGSDLSLGSSLRYLYRNVAGSTGDAVGLDVGVLLAHGPWTVGWTIQTMTLRPARYQHTLDYLPRMMRAGTTYRFELTPFTSWLFALDVVQTHPSAPPSVRSGVEMQIGSFAVRSGYRTADVHPAQWQVGFGLAMPVRAFGANARLAFDYTYERPQGWMGHFHSLSVTLQPGLFHDAAPLNSAAPPTIPTTPAPTPAPVPTPAPAPSPAPAEPRVLPPAPQVTPPPLPFQRQDEASQEKPAPAVPGARSRFRAHYIPMLHPVAWSSPAELPLPRTQRDMIRVHINFDTGKATIRSSEDPKIARLAAALAAAPDRLVWVAGHTDNEGTFTFNLDLSQRRIERVLEVLEDQYGIPRSRFVKPTAYGETRPIADNATAAGRALNRRVEFHLLSPDANPAAFTPEGSVIEGVHALNETTIAIFRNGRAAYALIPESGGRRLILDFPDFFSAANLRPMPPPTRRLIRGIQTQFDETTHRTRIIIDLARPAPYRIEEGGRVLMIHFDE